MNRLILICAYFIFAPIVWHANNLFAGDVEIVLPQYAPQKHMGVATCANSSCHAVKFLNEPSNVKQDEYFTWLFHDRHAKAYQTLLSVKSQKIANNLGLESAETARICLDCHADNVAEELRGSEFLMTDGVGCEACHGGSEVWLSRHTLTPYDGVRNVEEGMYPTGDLVKRTELCISCHVGSAQKFANHQIMGAGHPRLSFELDTFTIRQPEHYVVDADYLARKSDDNPVRRLFIGAAVHAQYVAQNLEGDLLDNPQGHPELALYDCHSCHHSLTNLQWKKRPSTEGLKPGSVRLNDGSFLLLAAITGALNSDLQRDIFNKLKALHSASSQSINELQKAAADLKQLAIVAQGHFDKMQLSNEQKQQIIKDLMNLGIRGELHDYIAAEQAVMAMDVLSYSLPFKQKLATLINVAYQLTQDDETYQPEEFKRLLGSYIQSQ